MILIGILIGFYGYLFPGNINILVLDLYESKKYKSLFLILILILIFESAYCLITLFYLHGLKSNVHLFSMIELAAYSIVLLMGLWMLFENKSSEKVAKKYTLYRGVISIIIHPQQIPFWLLMGVMISPVINIGLDLKMTTSFVLCNALGTLLIMTFYMVYGSKLMHYFKLKLNQLNTVIGVLYITIAVISLSKIFIYS